MLDIVFSIQVLDALLLEKGDDEFRDDFIGFTNKLCLTEEFPESNGVAEKGFYLLILSDISDELGRDFQTDNIRNYDRILMTQRLNDLQ